MNSLSFSSCPVANIRCQGPLDNAKAQPCHWMYNLLIFNNLLHGNFGMPVKILDNIYTVHHSELNLTFLASSCALSFFILCNSARSSAVSSSSSLKQDWQCQINCQSSAFKFIIIIIELTFYLSTYNNFAFHPNLNSAHLRCKKLEIPLTSRVWMNEKVKHTNLDKMQHSTQQKYNPIVQESFFYISQSDYVQS